jgi:ADP-ribose pyrophosphatase
VLLMLRQFRYAAGGELYEIPAGRPDSDTEPWEVCARRELEEETGFRAGSLEYLTGIWTTPGFTDELIHLFLARDLTPGKVATDADEFLEVVRMPLSEALDRIDRGEISDAKTICAIGVAARRIHATG